MDGERSRLGIYFLDVGQGDCTVIVPPRGEGDPILFDCADAFVARCFMAAPGVTSIQPNTATWRST